MRAVFLTGLCISLLYFIFSVYNLVPSTSESLAYGLNIVQFDSSIATNNAQPGYTPLVNTSFTQANNPSSVQNSNNGLPAYIDAVALGFNFIAIFTGVNILLVFYQLGLPWFIELLLGVPFFALYLMGLYQAIRNGIIPN